MWRVWRVTGIGPDECLKPTYGGCLDPWEQEWENGGSDPETMSGGTNSFLGGFDNMRSGRQLWPRGHGPFEQEWCAGSE